MSFIRTNSSTQPTDEILHDYIGTDTPAIQRFIDETDVVDKNHQRILLKELRESQRSAEGDLKDVNLLQLWIDKIRDWFATTQTGKLAYN